MQDRLRPSLAGSRQLKDNARRRENRSSKSCTVKISVFVHHQPAHGPAAHSSARKIEQRLFGLPKHVPTTCEEQREKGASNCVCREHCHSLSKTRFILSCKADLAWGGRRGCYSKEMKGRKVQECARRMCSLERCDLQGSSGGWGLNWRNIPVTLKTPLCGSKREIAC
jgi:hypothetical protein